MAKSSSKSADKKIAAKAAGAALKLKRDVLKAAEALDVTDALGGILQKKSITAAASTDLGDDDRQWISALTETNMKPVCGETAWLDGGIGKETMRDAFTEGSRYLIARAPQSGLAERDANVDSTSSGVPVAFVRYRFELLKDADVPVLRVHSLQVDPKSQRTGLGKLLTLLTEMVAKKANVGGVMVAIGRDGNDTAKQFYAKTRYHLSDLSVSKVNPWAGEGESPSKGERGGAVDLFQKIFNDDSLATIQSAAKTLRAQHEKAMHQTQKNRHGDADGDLSWTTGRY
tara:strand:+ start:26 stop:883 length:858 start_codon:yes stop_codon:yes gene_type:complete